MHDHSTPRDTTRQITPSLIEELKASIRGSVHLPDSTQFSESSYVFNASLVSPAKLVVRPLDAQDVSRVVLFCTKHKLSPSARAGGYGIPGFSISGDIIIDLVNLSGIDIEPPHPDGSYTSLRDTVPRQSKGKIKKKSRRSGPTSGEKRRRAQEGFDDEFDDDDISLAAARAAASRAVATFLHGPPLPLEADGVDGISGQPPPTNRRRIESSTNTPLSLPRHAPLDGNVPTFEHVSIPSISADSSDRDPFGYLDEDDKSPLPPVDPSLNPHGSRFPSRNPAPLSESFIANSTILSGRISKHHSHATPLHSHAYVSFGSGAKQKNVDQFTSMEENMLMARYLDATEGGVPYHIPFSAHPVGSAVMLLGGFGFQSRLHGLSVDNLVEVEMVMADGSIIVVDKHEHPDLWWAVRGAGPAFGIATRYKAVAYPVPAVYAGNLIYRFHVATAPSLLKHFRDCVKGAPRELYANVLLTSGPAGKDSLVVIQLCYMGLEQVGKEFADAIASWEGEDCLLSEICEKRFVDHQESVAQVLRLNSGNECFIRSAILNSLPDGVIDETVLKFSRTISGCTWLFELAGGAVEDTTTSCLPMSHRQVVWNVVGFLQISRSSPRKMSTLTTEDWIENTLGPVSVGGSYPSFFGRHEPHQRIISSFGENWERLASLKRRYDPECLFKHNFWPLDASGQVLAPATHEPMSR